MSKAGGGGGRMMSVGRLMMEGHPTNSVLSETNKFKTPGTSTSSPSPSIKPTTMKWVREYWEDSRAFCSMCHFKIINDNMPWVPANCFQRIDYSICYQCAEWKRGHRFPGFRTLISALLKILVFHQANLLSTLSQDLVSNNSFSSLSILARFWQLKGRLNRKRKMLKPPNWCDRIFSTSWRLVEAILTHHWQLTVKCQDRAATIFSVMNQLWIPSRAG